MTLVFVSACAGLPGASSGGAGVVPLEFKFSPSKALSGDKTLLSLTVQNTGSIEAKNVNVFLFGLSTDWREDGGPYKAAQPTFNLEPPRPETKVPGQKNTLTWILTAPQYIPQKIPFSYTAFARICYPYKTTASGSIEILSENEFVSLQREGKIRERPVTVKTTSAPVSVTIDTTQPLLWRTDRKVTFRVTVTNSGGGTVMSPDLNCDSFKTGLPPLNASQINKINFKIEGLGFTCDVSPGFLFFERGQSQSLAVTCPIGDLPVVPRLDKQVELTLDYNYYIDTSATVTVEGLDVGQAPSPTATAPTAPAPTAPTTTTTPSTTTPPSTAPASAAPKTLAGPCSPHGKLECFPGGLYACATDQWLIVYDCAVQRKTCNPSTLTCT